MKFGLGGVHGSVIPFRNFGFVGLLLAFVLFSFLIVRVEQACRNKATPANTSVLVAIAATLPHWLWYGDKYMVNAVIIVCIILVLRRLSMLR